jgi:hypothetical protein
MQDAIVKTVDKYCATYFNMLFPGIFLLEVVFHKGIFSNNISNLYSFIIYLIWAFAISMLFKWIVQTTLALRKQEKEGFASMPDDQQDMLELPILITYAVITYILFQIINHYQILAFVVIFDISTRFIHFVLSLFLMFGLAFPLSTIYLKILIKMSNRTSQVNS